MSAIQEFIFVISKGNCNVSMLLVSCALCCIHLVQMFPKTVFSMLNFLVIDAAMKDLPTVRLLAFLLFYGT